MTVYMAEKKILKLFKISFFQPCRRSRRSPLPVRKVHTMPRGNNLPCSPGSPVSQATEPSAGGCRPSLAEARTQRPTSTRQGQRKASRSPSKPREPINPATEPSAGAVGRARPKPKPNVQRPRIRGSARYQGAPALRMAARHRRIQGRTR